MATLAAERDESCEICVEIEPQLRCHTIVHMAGMNLQALVESASSADPVARDRAYAELLRLVSIFVRVRMGNRLRDHRDSADVCQSIAKSFVDDAAKGQLRFDSPAALSAYLQRVVQTKLAELARHDTADKRGGAERGRSPLESDTAADDPTASLQAVSNESFDRILSSLSEDERELVKLRRGGASWSAISAALNTPEMALRQRWSRLQRRIEEMVNASR